MCVVLEVDTKRSQSYFFSCCFVSFQVLRTVNEYICTPFDFTKIEHSPPQEFYIQS